MLVRHPVSERSQTLPCSSVPFQKYKNVHWVGTRVALRTLYVLTMNASSPG